MNGWYCGRFGVLILFVWDCCCIECGVLFFVLFELLEWELWLEFWWLWLWWVVWWLWIYVFCLILLRYFDFGFEWLDFFFFVSSYLLNVLCDSFVCYEFFISIMSGSWLYWWLELNWLVCWLLLCVLIILWLIKVFLKR